MLLNACRPCTKAALTAYDLWTADEVFLSSTAGGIVPVVEVDGRRVGGGRPGPIYEAIVMEYRTMLERGEHGTPVVSGAP